MITTPGVYKISSDEYHSDPCPSPSISKSVIKDLLFRSPAHGWHCHPRLNPDFKRDDGAGKFDLGTAAHAMLFESADNIMVIDAPDWRTKAAKEEREQARIDGKTPLLTHQYEETKLVVEAAERQILACKELGISNLLEDGDAELSYIWEEEGIWLKVRPDWISKDRRLIIDFKTTETSANPLTIDRLISNMSYDIQAALYCRGVRAIEKIDPKFIFVFQEMEEPYMCSFIGLSPQWMELGKSKVEYGLYLFRKCLANDDWPGYPQRIAWIDPPPWAVSAFEVRAADIGEGQ